MPDTAVQSPPAPLTTLTEDEVLFRDNVRQFAEEKVRPLAKEMDEKGVFDHGLIEQFFQLGLMAIEVPEQFGGAGGTFFEAILAVEELSRAEAAAALGIEEAAAAKRYFRALKRLKQVLAAMPGGQEGT